MRQKLFFAFVFLFSLSPLLQAQNQRYEKAYIIKSDGDTLSGTMHIPKNQSHYLRVNFFLNGNFDKAKQYKPGQILEYGYKQDNIFRSYLITDTSNAMNKSSVFLKVLVDNDGTYSLLVYRDPANTPIYFIEDEKGAIIELCRLNLNEQLRELSKNCDKTEISEMVSNVKYNSSRLSKFINTYNSCIDSTYVTDELYLSEGIRNFGIKIGTGFGPALLKHYPLDSPDLNIALRLDYSINKNNSVILETGFSKRSMTYSYGQMGSVSVYSIPTSVSKYGEIQSTSKVDANFVYATLSWKKNLDRMYYGISGGVTVKLSSSDITYAAVLNDDGFKNQLDRDIYVEDQYKIINMIPSFYLIAGTPINVGSLKGDLEFSVGYLNIKADNEQWTYSEVPSKVSILDSDNYPQVEYTVAKPKMPKLVFDISVVLPVFKQ